MFLNIITLLFSKKGTKDSENKIARVLIDCSETFYVDLNTGIQRVVKNIVIRSGRISDKLGIPVIPIVLDTYGYIKLEDFLNKNKNSDKNKIKKNIKENIKKIQIEKLHINKNIYLILKAIWVSLKKIKFLALSIIQKLNSFILFKKNIIYPGENDLFLLLDAVWDPLYNKYFYNFIKKLKKQNGKIVTLIHDIIPITDPEFFEKEFILKFEKTLNKIIKLSDFILTTSKSEADVIQKYINDRLNTKKKLSYFYLGCDFNEECNFSKNSGSIREHRKSFYGLSASANMYLMVGTIEPRKGHDYVFESFENLWRNDFDGVLIIVGKIGWNMESFLEKINRSIYLNKKLFVLNDINDEELHYLYNSAYAIICASLREGFGLPLIEAMKCGKPIFASDIPVFREIGEDYPVYFNPIKEGLIKAIEESQNQANKKEYKNKNNHLINWDYSVDMLADRITELIL